MSKPLLVKEVNTLYIGFSHESFAWFAMLRGEPRYGSQRNHDET